MKKTFAEILAVLMILCMGTTVFASTSPIGGEAVYNTVTSSASAQAGSNVSVSKVTTEVYNEAVKETSGAVVSMAEIKLNNVTSAELLRGVSVTITISTLKADDNVNTIRIMHKRALDGKWEIIVPSAVNASNMTVTFTLYDASPIAVVRYTTGPAPSSTQQIPGNSGSSSSSGSSNSSSSSSSSGSSGSSGGSSSSTGYNEASGTLSAFQGETVINVTKTTKDIYDEAARETTGTIVSIANISLNNVSSVNLSKGVKFSVLVSSLRSDASVNTIRLLHKRSSDGRWEIIVPSYVNPVSKVVTATFYDFSPVAIVQYPAGNAPSSTQYIPTSSSGNQGSQNPGGSTGTQDPGNSTGTQNPGSSTGTQDPGSSTGTQDPGNSTGTQDPGSSTGTQDPQKTNNEGTGNNQNINNTPSAKPANSNNKTGTKSVNTIPTVHVSGTSAETTSPRTGSSLPALPIIAMFSLMGIAYCGKKAKSL